MEDYFMMWFSEIKTLDRGSKELLLRHFESPGAVWNAAYKEIAAAAGASAASHLAAAKDMDALEARIKVLDEKEIRYISVLNPDYPYLLKQIHDPPFGIYVKGSLPSPDLIWVAVIGSRRCSDYGASVAYRFASELAARGVVVVSGMAEGVDSLANRGAIDAGGLTAAVLGCGVDVTYPAANEDLKEEIIKSGCVISELPPGTEARRWHFPARNRIISGLSRGILVVEAARRSGTSITVDFALSEGREVFAVPGSIFSKLSRGTNEMIYDGANVALAPEDILEVLGLWSGNTGSGAKKAVRRKAAPKEEPKEDVQAGFPREDLTDGERRVFSLFGKEPVDMDALADGLDMAVREIQANLTTLELKGYIRGISGMKYLKAL